MNDTELYSRFALASGVVAGLGTAGGWLLLFAPRTWVGRGAAAAAAVVVSSGLAALLCPEFLAVVAGVGAAVAATATLVSTAAVRRFVVQSVSPICKPRLIGAAAVLAAVGLWGFEAWKFDRECEAMLDHTLASVQDYSPPATAPVAFARTDRGSAIELHSPTHALSANELCGIEQSSNAINQWSGRVIHRGAADDQSNCHGWVFTGGQYNLMGKHVDTILSDNGYTAVSTPTPGDVCVYRRGEDSVAHTGIVRAILPDGTVLVESKWGRMGVYLHAAADSCYGNNFQYYHTKRGGHLLQGLTGGGGPGSEKPIGVATVGG